MADNVFVIGSACALSSQAFSAQAPHRVISLKTVSVTVLQAGKNPLNLPFHYGLCHGITVYLVLGSSWPG